MFAAVLFSIVVPPCLWAITLAPQEYLHRVGGRLSEPMEVLLTLLVLGVGSVGTILLILGWASILAGARTEDGSWGLLAGWCLCVGGLVFLALHRLLTQRRDARGYSWLGGGAHL